MSSSLHSLLAIALLLGGCSGGEEVPVEGPQRSASLRVVVWSTYAQGAVAAEGVLTSRSTGAQQAVQTSRANPSDGCVLSGLQPGAYRLQITRRFDGSRAQRVEGLEDIYLEPGQSASITIVVTDREGELGRARTRAPTSFDSCSPSVATSHLPRASRRAEGPG
jgi:hypothetical protein